MVGLAGDARAHGMRVGGHGVGPGAERHGGPPGQRVRRAPFGPDAGGAGPGRTRDASIAPEGGAHLMPARLSGEPVVGISETMPSRFVPRIARWGRGFVQLCSLLSELTVECNAIGIAQHQLCRRSL